MPQVIGLDIGTRAVRAAQFERGFRGLELSGFQEVAFDPSDPEGLGKALGELAGRLQPGNATIVARVPGDRLLMRLLDFPMSDAKKLEQVVPFEVEQQIPYELEEVVLDHSILSRNPEGGAKVLIAAARKQEIRETLEMLTKSMLEPRFVAAGPSALASLATAIPSLAQGTVAIVDTGWTRTDVCVLRDGHIVYARTISSGVADVVDAAAEAGADTTSVPERANLPGMEVAADYVAREVRHTLMAAEVEAGLTIDKIALFGALTRMTGFGGLLERTTGILVDVPVLAEAEWAKVQIPGPAAAEAAAPIALAFRTISDASIAGVNFRRDEFAFRRDAKELSVIALRFAWIVGALLVLALVNYGVRERLLAREKKALDWRIANEVVEAFPEISRDRLSSPDTAVSIMRGNMGEARQRLAQLGGGGMSALEVLRVFSETVPAGTYIDVKKFTLNEGKGNVQCVLDDYEAAEKLKSALSQVQGFTNVDFRESGNEPGGKRKVSFVFDVDQGAGT